MVKLPRLVRSKLRTRPEFQLLFDSRAFDMIASTSQQILKALDGLRAELKTAYQHYSKQLNTKSQHTKCKEWSLAIRYCDQ